MVTFFLAAYLALAAAAVLWLAIKASIPIVFQRTRARRGSPPPVPESVDVVFTLLHGTWAKDASWTRDGSALTEALYAVAPRRVLIERLPWSGRNSIGARKRAMEHLLRHLAVITDSYPLAQHFIVAHSHGGNIALYALNEPELARKIRGVICLSTPFLNIRDRNLGAIKRSGLLAAVIVVPMYTCAWLLNQRFPNHEDLNFAIAAAIGLIAGLSLARKAASVTGRLADSLRLAALPHDRLLIVRAAGDEASAALSALQLASWLATQFWIWPAVFVGSVESTIREWAVVAGTHWKGALAMVVAGAILTFGSNSLFANHTLARVCVSVGTVILAGGSGVFLVAWAGSGAGLYGYVFNFVLSGLLLFPLLAILAILVVPFGWELAIACTRLDVTVEATPPGTWVVHQLSPLSTGALKGVDLSHAATHDRADAIHTVVSWVESKLSAVA